MMELSFRPEDRILIAAPHPDDETIGLGGLILKYAPQCDVVLLTDGRRGTPGYGQYSEEEVAELRKAEFTAVMQKAGVRSFTCLAAKDKRLVFYPGRIFGLDLSEYDYIFVPNRHEGHKDHRWAYRYFRLARLVKRGHAKLCEYEVWTPLVKPNRMLDIEDVYEAKQELLKGYPSQLSTVDYEGMADGLSRYRGASSCMRRTEAYLLHLGTFGWLREKISKEYAKIERRRAAKGKA